MIVNLAEVTLKVWKKKFSLGVSYWFVKKIKYEQNYNNKDIDKEIENVNDKDKDRDKLIKGNIMKQGPNFPVSGVYDISRAGWMLHFYDDF